MHQLVQSSTRASAGAKLNACISWCTTIGLDQLTHMLMFRLSAAGLIWAGICQSLEGRPASTHELSSASQLNHRACQSGSSTAGFN